MKHMMMLMAVLTGFAAEAGRMAVPAEMPVTTNRATAETRGRNWSDGPELVARYMNLKRAS